MRQYTPCLPCLKWPYCPYRNEGRDLEKSWRLVRRFPVVQAAHGWGGKLPLPTTFTKFLIVGAIGYLINQFTLFLVYDTPLLWFLPTKETDIDLGLFTHTDIRLFLATVVAVEAAIISNFTWHERWTFRDRAQSKPRFLRFAQFNVTSIGSPIISVATVNILTPAFGVSPYITNSLGIALGLIWNWLWNTQLVWQVSQQEIRDF